jgi:deoxycytidylate deaminase
MDILDHLKAKGLYSTTNRRIDLKHLLSAERAARGGFYATRVGFVAINPKGQRIARAHNGFPQKVHETRERWTKTEKDFYHLHAECAGIFHAARHGYATQGATAYVTHPPCPGCMRMLIASGFSRIVFSEQALVERTDWRDDMIHSFELAQRHAMTIAIYRDKERSLKFADITRTELELKVVYDQLLPQARWSSHDKSAISKATKPESPDWVEHPVIEALVAAARKGVSLEGRGVIMDFLPECRAATAMIQAGVSKVFVLREAPDSKDPRWGVALEVDVARKILEEDAGITVKKLEDNAAPKSLPVCLDATREGATLPHLSLIRISE